MPSISHSCRTRRPSAHHGKKGSDVVSPWPSEQEMKYDGAEHRSVGFLRGGFPQIPRVERTKSVTWQYQAPIPQSPFCELYHCPIYLGAGKMWRHGQSN